MIPFSLDINTLPARFQIECIELLSGIQFKEKTDCIICLLDFYKTCLNSEKYSMIHKHILFMSLLLYL